MTPSIPVCLLSEVRSTHVRTAAVPCDTLTAAPWVGGVGQSTQPACTAYCPPGHYTEAAEKYARARDNLEGMANSEAVQVRRACVLNLSMCYLNTKQYTQCVECCQQVLTGEPRQQRRHWHYQLSCPSAMSGTFTVRTAAPWHHRLFLTLVCSRGCMSLCVQATHWDHHWPVVAAGHTGWVATLCQQAL